MKTNNPVKILLVDDLPENLFALELILSNNNYKCVKAHSGNEALKILLHEQDFAILLMDVQMPEMDGFETVELIREIETLKHVPVIFLTASMDNSMHIFKGYQAGAVDYMIKPLVPEILTAKVAVFVELYLKTHELLAQNEEKEKRAVELAIANKELAFQNKEKEKRAVELSIAKDKAEESDRLKSAFLSNISHEIRTPMNGILGFAELLKEPHLNLETHRKYIGIIEKSGKRMLNILNDIVSLSKIESGLMEVDIQETDINQQIDFIHSFFKPEIEEKGIHFLITKSLKGKEAYIQSDSEKIYGILTNIVKNAVKFTKEGTIELGVQIKIENGSSELEFYIKDTGIGIPKDRQLPIFSRFIQADVSGKMAYQGAGLGLSISKSYVEILGGKIWVESEVGKGSTFYFTLPYRNDPEEKIVIKNEDCSEQMNQKVNPEVSDLKILIAEDDEISGMLLSFLVKDFSKKLFRARTGIEAVNIFRNNPDIDLILMDIQMPELNGDEATRQIRQFNKEVIIIAQTGLVMSIDKESVIESGCNDYISKPIKREILNTLIQKYFKK